MRRRSRDSAFRLCTIAAALLVAGADVRADDFEISVQIGPAAEKNEDAAAKRTVQTTWTGLEPFRGPRKPRPIFQAKSGEAVWVRWKAKYEGTQKLQDVLVHFFVNEEEEAGQEARPKLGKDVVHEGALTLDFGPGDEAKGEFMLQPQPAGVYLVRVETQNLVGQHGHEHYAALDLLVK